MQYASGDEACAHQDPLFRIQNVERAGHVQFYVRGGHWLHLSNLLSRSMENPIPLPTFLAGAISTSYHERALVDQRYRRSYGDVCSLMGAASAITCCSKSSRTLRETGVNLPWFQDLTACEVWYRSEGKRGKPSYELNSFVDVGGGVYRPQRRFLASLEPLMVHGGTAGPTGWLQSMIRRSMAKEVGTHDRRAKHTRGWRPGWVDGGQPIDPF